MLLSGTPEQETGPIVGAGADVDVLVEATVLVVEDAGGGGGGGEFPHAGSDGNTQALPQQTVPSPHVKGGVNGAVETKTKRIISINSTPKYNQK
jgi:hypothetical protein